MSPHSRGLILAILCALCWALVDFGRKRISQEASAVGTVVGLNGMQIPFLLLAMSVGSLSTSDGASTTAQIVEWATKMQLTGFVTWEQLTVVWWGAAIVSVGLNLIANLLFIIAIQSAPLSLTLPYLAFTPVFSAITSLLILGEVPSPLGWLGIGIVCFGAFTLNRGDSSRGLLAPVYALWEERGSLYMLLVSLCWSITPIMDKVGMELTNIPAQTLTIAAGVSIGFILIRSVADRSPVPILSQFRQATRFMILTGFLNVLAMTFQLSAYAYTDISYVETTKRAVGVISSVIVGYLVFHEREDAGRRFIGALVMVGGVALVMFG